MAKNIYLIVTDAAINGVKDLKKLENEEFATITDLDNGCGSWETYNATQPQAAEVVDIVITCHKALAEEMLICNEEE